MTRPEKKASELRALRAVLERVDLGIVGTPEVLDGPIRGERPDLRLVWPDGRVIGVEVAELSDHPMALGMGVYKIVEGHARELMKRENLSACVHLSIRDGAIDLLGKHGKPRQIAAAIVDLVREQLARGEESRVYLRADQQRRKRGRAWLRAGANPHTFPREPVSDELERRGLDLFWRISVDASDDGPDIWRGAGRVGLGMSSVPQKILDDKTREKLPEYRANLPGCEIWIVLLAGMRFDSGVPSMMVEDARYSSGFDRAFYVDVDATRVFHAYEIDHEKRADG